LGDSQPDCLRPIGVAGRRSCLLELGDNADTVIVVARIKQAAPAQPERWQRKVVSAAIPV